ncbi:unnamed protein product, partial [Staurois parvus]
MSISASSQCSSMPLSGPISAHQCHITVAYQCDINATYHCPSELPFSVTHPPVPPINANQCCQSVPPISASQCRLSVPVNVSLCHLSVLPISATYQCQSVPPKQCQSV